MNESPLKNLLYQVGIKIDKTWNQLANQTIAQSDYQFCNQIDNQVLRQVWNRIVTEQLSQDLRNKT